MLLLSESYNCWLLSPLFYFFFDYTTQTPVTSKSYTGSVITALIHVKYHIFCNLLLRNLMILFNDLTSMDLMNLLVALWGFVLCCLTPICVITLNSVYLYE